MSLETRLNKLETRQPGAALTPTLVATFVCPKLGITGARWLDGSTLERGANETEAAFIKRMEAQSAIVFAGSKYGVPDAQ